MYLRRDQLTRIARAPAKLNLYLEILGRCADGFHELETLMVPITLFDTLSFTAQPSSDRQRGAIELDVTECYSTSTDSQCSWVPRGGDNLVVRALELLRERSDCSDGASVTLVKRIPVSAGLGGGSSDAAAALRLANAAWRLAWPVERLAELAAEIGSDVPFFVYGGAAICRGRGEQVERLPAMRPLDFVVVKPPVGISTAAVYRHFSSNPEGVELLQRPRMKGFRPVSGKNHWQPELWMRNRLQAASAAISPWVERLRKVFGALDFVSHQLSGSGSAYFGVCRHPQHARRLATILRTQQLGLVYATRSCA
jgi:4-diphosphocytidyl-2-C-methyl-D-erythritol kinase